MSEIKVFPSSLCGTVTAPPSKSDVHRAIICAALSRGVCRISPVAFSNDIRATIACAEALGAGFDIQGNTLTVDGRGLFRNKEAELFCGESGSTLRFFIPVAAAGGVSARFSGCGRLPSRPIGVYSSCLPKAGVSFETEGGLPLKLSGRLRPGVFELPGDVSSQFVTGLLFALPLLGGDSRIILTSPLQSAAYVDMTIETMRRFGVEAEQSPDGWFIKGGQTYEPCDYQTDGDWSQAAFFMTAGALSGDITVRGVRAESVQGDKEIYELLRRFGAEVGYCGDGVRVKKSELHPIEINARQIPDLVPVLAAAAAFADGTTRISGAERLRIKESDRLNTTAAMLNALGGNVEELPDGLLIHGAGGLSGGRADGANDHRIVMAAAVAALGARGSVTITDRESINKSFPNFFEEYSRLGGKILCHSSEKI